MQANVQTTARAKVLIMDVYETILDMGAVEKRFNNLTDSRRGYTVWFEMFMQYCFVDNCTSQFNDFSSIASATMRMTGRMFDRNISDFDISNILRLLEQLPVQEQVQQGLSKLHDQGFRVAALTNSPEKTVRTRMEATGLISYFEMVLSAERVKKYKPCAEVYQWAAQLLGVNLHEMLLVSAHPWDIAGAAHAGMQTAFIDQAKQILYPLAPHSNYVAKDLADLADQLQAI